MGTVFNKTLPQPRWIQKEHEACDRSYFRALWQAQPAWADAAAMRRIYERARRQKRHVDHLVPIRHPDVCGLHVPHNLCVVRDVENMAKGNRWWPGMWLEQQALFEPIEFTQLKLRI